MNSRILKPVLAFCLAVSFSALLCQPSSAQGWFQKATGIKTPEPIRKIAPNGISIGGRQDSGSHLQVYTPGHIDSNGNVWSGTSNSGGTNRIVGKATIKRNSNGQAFWTYGNYSPVRASQHDRGASKPELLGREASGDIQLDNRVTIKKIPTTQPQSSQTFPNQNGMTQKQQDQALLFNSIGQLVQGISQAAQQNRQQNPQNGGWGQPQQQQPSQQQWGQPQQQPQGFWRQSQQTQRKQPLQNWRTQQHYYQP